MVVPSCDAVLRGDSREVADVLVEELASLDAEILGRVAGLPNDQRLTVLSRVVDERSYEEIAAELRCSEMAVRQRVSRGLNALRSRTEEPS